MTFKTTHEDSEQDDELVDINFSSFTMEKSSDLNLSTETENQMEQFPNVVASDSQMNMHETFHIHYIQL